MIIEFSKKIPKTYQIEIASAIEFCCYEFFHGRTRKVLEIYVDSVDEKDSAWGLLEWENEYVRPREFTMSLNVKKRPISDILKTVMHEMIHVEQFVSGRLKHRFYPQKKILWDNIEVDIDAVSYYDLPWEIEAFDQEGELFDKFKKHRWSAAA